MKYRYLILILSLCLPLAAQSAWNAPGDTLSVIMQPIMNVPQIVVPGENLLITALTDEGTSGWTAALIHADKRIDLPVQLNGYNAELGIREMSAPIPNIPVFELYDLELSATGGIYDLAKNAVQVLPSRKQSYYFIHITDLHLPNRVYYPNPGYEVDSLEVNDFRAVIEDINLIRPEFVLITGDLVNEGELEGFAGQYWYGWTQRLLELIEVPIFVLGGNHDLGGWDDTPAPQGSARRNWWRYFGWPWLNTTNSPSGLYTQDYSFRYGDVHYIGLETYINYDDWRYNIYGNTSLIPSQWQWLNLELALDPPTKVLFYHYDFEEEFYLQDMGVQLALWGHTHSNEGSIYEQPYNLGTRSVCSGNRAYRVIKVNGTNLMPQNTIYAGDSGTSLYHYFLPSNMGVADSVQCVVVNNHSQAFDQGLLKFNMPHSPSGYSVSGGVLEQVDDSGDYSICYVRVNIMAGLSRYISVKTSPVSNEDVLQAPVKLSLNAFPNPFSQVLQLKLDTPSAMKSKLKIHNLKGQLVRELEVSDPQKHSFTWDGLDSKAQLCPAGIYIFRAIQGKNMVSHKVIKL